MAKFFSIPIRSSSSSFDSVSSIFMDAVSPPLPSNAFKMPRFTPRASDAAEVNSASVLLVSISCLRVLRNSFLLGVFATAWVTWSDMWGSYGLVSLGPLLPYRNCDLCGSPKGFPWHPDLTGRAAQYVRLLSAVEDRQASPCGASQHRWPTGASVQDRGPSGQPRRLLVLPATARDARVHFRP